MRKNKEGIKPKQYQIISKSPDAFGERRAEAIEIEADNCFVSYGGVIVFELNGAEVFFYRQKEGEMIQEVKQ